MRQAFATLIFFADIFELHYISLLHLRHAAVPRAVQSAMPPPFTRDAPRRYAAKNMLQAKAGTAARHGAAMIRSAQQRADSAVAAAIDAGRRGFSARGKGTTR
jgi:hypothetical protein